MQGHSFTLSYPSLRGSFVLPWQSQPWVHGKALVGKILHYYRSLPKRQISKFYEPTE